MIILTMSEGAPGVLEQMLPTAEARRSLRIGLPACQATGERRFPLTPEAAGVLVGNGFALRIEHGAGESIHYPDSKYASEGAGLTDRTQVLGCDVVISLAPLEPSEIKLMRRGAALLTLSKGRPWSPQSLHALMERHVTMIALDLIADADGHTPFADILAEVDGRAAIAVASAIMSNPDHGKGILLGGISGVSACEVTIIGSGLAATSAASAAMGLGAVVRIFDNDLYSLRRARRIIGEGMNGSTLHPRVLHNALRTADVVVATPMEHPFRFDREDLATVKRGVVLLDLTDALGSAFPSLPAVDACSVQRPAGCGSCIVNVGSSVPRTAAMAISDAMLTLLGNIAAEGGVTDAMRSDAGLRRAACIYAGKAVNPSIARVAGTRAVDISIFLTLS